MSNAQDWNDVNLSHNSLLELAKKQPKVYSNANLPYSALLEGAKTVPWIVEQNPAIGLFALEDPKQGEEFGKALMKGWRDAGVKALSENSQWLYAADCAEHVLYHFESKYPNDRRPREVIDVIRRFALGLASNDELQAASTAADSALSDAFSVAFAGAAAAAASAADYAAVGAPGCAADTAASAAYLAMYSAAKFPASSVARAQEKQWQVGRVRFYFEKEKER